MSTPIYLNNTSANPYYLEDAEALPVFGESLASVASVTSVNGRKGDVILTTSDITNDSGYITKDVEDLTNYTRTDELPTKLSQFENDEGFQNSEQIEETVSTAVSQHNESEEAHTDIREDISGIDTRLQTAEGDIDSLESRMDTAEGAITTAEGDIDSLEGRMDTAENDIDLVEGRANSLETRMDTAEGDIDSLEGRADGLESRMTTAEGDIDSIEGKIPVQATSSNQLADKEFVNSSIATNTANYISNNGEPFTSVAQLEAYSGPVSNNDYAFVTGTEGENTYYDRYKATVSGQTVTWAKEYRLNNSSFTAAQWSAIDSGITSNGVEKLTSLAEIKTIGTNLNLDNSGNLTATDTTYSNFTGTDGTSAGQAGLVPAPTTAQVGYYLKSNGTWSEVVAVQTINSTDWSNLWQ